MTRRENRHASERKSRIEEDKRLPEIAQLRKKDSLEGTMRKKRYSVRS